ATTSTASSPPFCRSSGWTPEPGKRSGRTARSGPRRFRRRARASSRRTASIPRAGTQSSSVRIIQTERLELRLLAETDLAAWADFLADPAAPRLLHTPEPVLDRERAFAGLRSWVSLADGDVG